jgi:hypothetical protein
MLSSYKPSNTIMNATHNKYIQNQSYHNSNEIPTTPKKIEQIPWIDFKHNIIHREKQETHIICLTNIEQIRSINIYNWEYNRPIDKTRIPDIVKNNKEKTMLEGTIYLIKQREKYYCYDGMHRLTSFPQLNQQCKIIVDIMLEPSQGTIVDRFTHINQSISVPELFTNNMFEQEKKQIIMKVVSYFEHKYKSFFSPKLKYNLPNCNREAMFNKLTYIMNEDPTKEHYTYDEWLTFLHDISEQIREKIGKHKKYKLSVKQYEKCAKSNFFLFAVKNWEDEFML